MRAAVAFLFSSLACVAFIALKNAPARTSIALPAELIGYDCNSDGVPDSTEPCRHLGVAGTLFVDTDTIKDPHFIAGALTGGAMIFQISQTADAPIVELWNEHGDPLAYIWRDGHVDVDPSVTNDEVAMRFWEALAAYVPCKE